MSTHTHNHALRCALAAAAGAAAVIWLGPPGADLAAHVYQRAMFIQHGFTLWSNYWYAGHYSYVTYSVLYYPLAAVIGIKLLAVATAALAAAAFAKLVEAEWPSAGPWPARAFAFVAAASVLSGAYPYALGLAIGLLALRAARGDARVFAVLLALTFAASPLAFGLIALILIAAALSIRPRIGPRGAVVIALTTVGAVLWRLFPDGGRFPFSLVELTASLAFCAAGAAFTWRVPAARLLYSFFVVYAAACVTFFVIPTGIGENIARLRFIALPILVLAFSLRRWRPVLPAVLTLVLAASWNLTPLAFSYAHQSADPSARASYWQPAVRYLHRHLTPSYRVEAVDTSGHWEAVYLPQAGIPIARGWFRQDDFPQNALLYRKLRPGAYLAWLRGLGVRYVVLTDAPSDYSARGEARLLRSGRSGLSIVLETPHATVYTVPKPRRIVTGAPGAFVTHFGSSAIAVDLPAAGEYRVAVRYSPYWQAKGACLEQLHDGMLGIDVEHPAQLEIAFAVTAKRAPAAPAPPRPQIVQKPIPFGAQRRSETAAYALRHYGLHTWRLEQPRVIVEHYTASNSFSSAWSTFASDAPDSELHERPGTCAHFVIDRDGTIYQLVPLTTICRHTVGLNWTAIGIEHVGTSDASVLGNARQIASSLALTLWLMHRYAISLPNVIGHNESLTSRYHRERNAAWRCQTHGDWTHADMQAYRARVLALAGHERVAVLRSGGPVRSRC